VRALNKDKNVPTKKIKKAFELNTQFVNKLLKIVDAGLSCHLGKPIPGKMCVEAAVCYAMGVEHNDKPTCVDLTVREFKIRLNDQSWTSNEARAKGLRRIAVAQLGSFNRMDADAFEASVRKAVITKMIPETLTALLAFSKNHHLALMSLADLFRKSDGDWGMLVHLRDYVSTKNDTVCDALVFKQISHIIISTIGSDKHALGTPSVSKLVDIGLLRLVIPGCNTDAILTQMADIGTEALIECDAPGCYWLHLCEPQTKKKVKRAKK